MKKFKIVIYRDGGWFRKYKEEWEVEADNFYSDMKGVITFYKKGATDCDRPEIIAEFKADKYSIIPL